MENGESHQMLLKSHKYYAMLLKSHGCILLFVACWAHPALNPWTHPLHPHDEKLPRLAADWGVPAMPIGENKKYTAPPRPIGPSDENKFRYQTI